MAKNEKVLSREELEKQETERYLKELKENPPVYVEELPLKPREVVFSKLSDGEKFQVLTRYLNDLCAFTKSILQIVADQYVLNEFICDKLGIDVKAKKNELAKLYREQMEQNIEKAKQQIKDVAKKA